MTTEPFESYRPLLLGLAYRLLGGMWDAEDVVQQARARWSGTERRGMRQPRALLVALVVRLALDRMGSARVTREAGTGPRLPEPVATNALGPLDTPGLRDTAAYPAVHLMERLSPRERAVFVLCEAFGAPYGEIARILDTTETSCRQTHHRAARRMGAGRDRPGPGDDAYVEILTRLVAAARHGDRAGLTELFSPDAVAWHDVGGRAGAAPRPIEGREHVVAFAAGLLTGHPFGAPRFVDVNGRPALALTADGTGQVVVVDVRDRRIGGVYVVRDPEKRNRPPV